MVIDLTKTRSQCGEDLDLVERNALNLIFEVAYRWSDFAVADSWQGMVLELEGWAEG